VPFPNLEKNLSILWSSPPPKFLPFSFSPVTSFWGKTPPPQLSKLGGIPAGFDKANSPQPGFCQISSLLFSPPSSLLSDVSFSPNRLDYNPLFPFSGRSYNPQHPPTLFTFSLYRPPSQAHLAFFPSAPPTTARVCFFFCPSAFWSVTPLTVRFAFSSVSPPTSLCLTRLGLSLFWSSEGLFPLFFFQF